MQWRLMQGNIIKKRLLSFAFEKTPPHEPHLQASSSLIPGIPIWPIDEAFVAPAPIAFLVLSFFSQKAFYFLKFDKNF